MAMSPKALASDNMFKLVRFHLRTMGETDLLSATEDALVRMGLAHDIGPRDTACQIIANRHGARDID